MEHKKLIEVALPLEKINAESAREKSIRHGHPSTLHLWWARRPLAAARAVIWASLVDDPSSHPEEFPTEEDQAKERQRLFKILEELIVWENSNNEDILNTAKKEIMKSTGGNSLTLLDPFAGGGAIPLEAQRLGLQAHAHDLNPVAVMINKAMIEIPPKFADIIPVNSDVQARIGNEMGWKGNSGLASDVQYYGEWIKKEAFKRIGYIYPEIILPKDQGGDKATVIAWIWDRTIKCPNPACESEMPLASSFVISKKKGKEAWIEPINNNGKLEYKIHKDGKPCFGESISRKGAVCVFCGSPVEFSYIREEAKCGRMGARLAAIVAEGKKGRLYCNPTLEQERAANIDAPENLPEIDLPLQALGFRVQNYGITQYKQLFTNRQLVALKTFSELVKEAISIIEKDAIIAGMRDDHIPLEKGGIGAKAYSEAIGIYLSFAIDKLADIGSSLATWINSIGAIRNTFARQTLSMKWDYAEANPFSEATGCYSNMLTWVVKCIKELPSYGQGVSKQFPAQGDSELREIMVSTDPPYYDNIGYADLSDFFYFWMRESLRDIYPSLFSTMAVPKSEELIATPFRFDGSTEKAKAFFEDGMVEACKRINECSREDIPTSIYYAYKQTETDQKDGEISSTGWETILSAIIKAGFVITGTWPINTERSNRPRGISSNALATSIVLICRKRQNEAGQITRRNFISILKKELKPALKKIQSSNIAPVDLAQSAIGPGMGVFSRYRKVLESDGTPMTIRSALQAINEEIDLYFNEQVSDLDSASRFCIDLYTQNAYNDMKYGEAEVLANAKGTSISMMASRGMLYAKAGNVHLIEREKLPEHVDTNENNVWMLTQQLTQAMAIGGVEACAKIIFSMFGSNAERAKDLAYRLYTIAEQKKWANEAYAYNSLVVAWPDIQSRAAAMKAIEPKQMSLFDMDNID